MSKYGEFLAEQLKDPALKAEYDALDSEFSLIQAQIDVGKAIGVAYDRPDDKTVASKSVTGTV